MAIKSLKTEHYIAINYLSVPDRAGLTYSEIAQKCGVTRKTLYNWRNDSLFESELKRKMNKDLIKYLPEMLESMCKAVIENNDSAALELLLELNGMLPIPGLSVEDRLMLHNTPVDRVEDIKEQISDYKSVSDKE